jgi:hypothetical protein
MDETYPLFPHRRAEDHDAEILVPRTSSELILPLRPLAARPPHAPPIARFEPPISALGPLFRHRMDRIHVCRANYRVDINTRPTLRVLGGYYKSRRLVRVYVHDREEGRRPLEELFDTFLHEIAHHLEYTEPRAFYPSRCRRVPGLMHSRLFWKILGELKQRWADSQAQHARCQ